MRRIVSVRSALAAGAATAMIVVVALFSVAEAQAQQQQLPEGLINPSLSLPSLPSAGERAQAAGAVRGTNAFDAIRGQLRPKRHTVLGAGIAGRIDTFPVEVGDAVAADQLLVTMDCAVLEADQRASQARQMAASARHTVNGRLAKMNNISGLELDLSRAEMAMARAEEQRIGARMRSCKVAAPFAGVVIAKSAQAYQYVAEGEPLLQLVDNSELLVEAAVPSSWLAELKIGQSFTMHLDELAMDVKGRIEGTEGRVDPVSQTVRLIGSLIDPPKGLLAGMSGPIALAAEPRE
jgi:RND family efflux transporter MFP subunit